MTTREALVAAKARLTPDVWGQVPLDTVPCVPGAAFGTAWLKDQGKECLIMALSATVNGQPDEGTRYVFALRALRAALPPESDGLISVWNDTPGRTLGEVHALFDRAIEAQP
jgi:hypothetical protein